jgi:hypothetical protein
VDDGPADAVPENEGTSGEAGPGAQTPVVEPEMSP